MPTYDYRCNACEHEFELVQSMTAPVKRKCPQCGRLKLERLIGTGAGFIIKGRTSPPAEPKAPAASAEGGSSADSPPDSKSSDAAPTKVDAKNASDSAVSSDSGKEAAKNKSSPAPDPPEKKISGATSTPTHRAREGRGVGNLVDKARRMAKTKAKKKSGSKAKKPSTRRRSGGQTD
ncbi:MAG: zinc ribbon domain-containing protein [Phycisphaerales bacterium]|nr:zinc ribbon domain-containing protein [Phycisphaerales bacterium]